MREDDVTGPRRPDQDFDILGAGEAEVSDADDLQMGETISKATSDALVEVVVRREPDQRSASSSGIGSSSRADRV